MARPRGSRWLADIRLDDGTRLRPAFATKREAENWEEDARAAIAAGRPVPDPRKAQDRASGKTKTLHTIGGLFDHVCRAEWTNIRSAATAQRNGLDVVDYFGRKKEVAQITSHDIAEMKLHFAEEGLSPATVNRKVSALSKMLNVALDAEVIEKVLHWSPYNRRLCINIIPCVTIWVVLEGGNAP